MSDGIRGDRVRQMREARGWTQQDLAARSGIAQSTLSRIEGGKTRGSYAATLRTLARLFGCSEAYLSGDDGAPGPELQSLLDGEAAPTQGARVDAEEIAAEVLARGQVNAASVERVLRSGALDILGLPATVAAFEALANVVQCHAERRRR